MSRMALPCKLQTSGDAGRGCAVTAPLAVCGPKEPVLGGGPDKAQPVSTAPSATYPSDYWWNLVGLRGLRRAGGRLYTLKVLGPTRPTPGVEVLVPRFSDRRALAAAFLVLILVVAAWLRLSNLDVVLFEHDEAEWSIAALRLARGQELPLVGIPSLVWVATGPVFLYVLALPMLVSTDPAVVTGFVGLLSLVGVGLTFAFTRRYFGLAAAAIAGLTYATNPWAVYHSRKIWNPDLLPLCALVFFWALFLVVVERRRRFLPLAAAAAAVSLQLNQAGFYWAIVLLAVAVLYWRRLGWQTLLSAVAAGALVSAPFLYYEATHGFADLFLALQVGSGAAAVDLGAVGQTLSLAAGWRFPGEVFGVWTRPGEFVPDLRPVDYLATALFGVGLVALAARAVQPSGRGAYSERAKAVLLLVWLIVPTLVLTRHSFEVHQRYLLPTQPAQFVAMGVGLSALARLLARARLPLPRGRASFAAVALLPVLLVSGAQFWQYTTLLGLIERNGLEQSYGVPVRDYRRAMANAVRLSGQFPGEPVYVWASERTVDAVRYFAAADNLSIRQAAERNALLLGPETGRDRLYMVGFGGEAVETRLQSLGFVELPGESVAVPGGQTTFRFYRLPAGTRAALEATLGQAGPDLRLSNGLRLARWQAPTAVPSGGDLPLVAAWEAWREPNPEPGDPNYCLFQHLVDSAGGELAVKDATLEQTQFLHAGDLLLTWSEVPAPADAGPQQTWLDLGMFGCFRRGAVPVLDVAGNRVAGALHLGPFKLAPAAGEGVAAPQRLVGARLGENVELTGYDLSATSLRAGEALRLTLHWRARARPPSDYTVFVQLLRDGKVVAQQDNQPRAGKYPTSLWDAGETVVDDYAPTVPAGTPPGEYRLVVGMYTLADMRRLPVSAADGRPLGDAVDLGTVTVR